MPGRPKKPDDLHILEGTFREDRHGDPAERVILDGEPAPPEHLSDDAKAIWSVIVPPLTAAGVAKAADSVQLGIMVEWLARYRRYSAWLDKQGERSGKSRGLMYLVKSAAEAFDSIASRFGLTPTDRAKLRLPKAGVKAGVKSRSRA